ncbi:MAG: Rrf2 family transcriptional regulator [Candidatus Krumholzibacteriota bacterium]|nr:Rrf2 family transcriptional regulator [Candidatus Krumholzibacteriota bacterium]
MTGFVKISDAASLAFHATVYLASNEGKMVSNREISRKFKLSDAHLAKIMQRLSRAGIVKSVRGPGGGFTLTRSPDDLTLKDVYEAVESKIQTEGCLLDEDLCGCRCLLGTVLTELNGEISSRLENTKLSDVRIDLKKPSEKL